jgi:tetratricopeptide (TPR) repeat protein
MFKKLLLFFMLLSGVCFSQTEQKNSLLNYLKQNAVEDTSRINSLNKIADLYLNEASDSCLLFSKQAVALAEKLNYQEGLARAYSNIGSYYNGKGEYQLALKNYIDSYKIFEKLNLAKAMSNIMNSIGNTYLGINNNDKALEAYLKSYSIAEADSNKYMMAISSIGIGNIYIEKGDAKLALDYFTKAKNSFEKLNALYPLSVCYTLIGNALVEMNRFDEAFENFDKAIIQLKKMNNSYAVAGTYEIIAAAYEKQGSKNIALDFYLKAHKIFLERKAYDNLQKVCLRISSLYKVQKNFEKSLLFFEDYSHYKDSVFNTENNKQLLDVEAKYENEKKQQQIEVQNARLSEQQARQNFLLIGIGVVVLVLVLLYFGYHQKQKSNKALSQANDRLEVKNQIIQQKNKEITDSIVYAKQIQNTILPSEKYIAQALSRLNKQ